ncbi:MAG: glycerol-3-phosphate acyltransferase [Acidobacteria bacterium]|nr:glycerol-3-phosphate acyltransferase [Acidobacteriota bacterium]
MLDSKTAIEALVCFLSGAIPFAVIAMWGSGVDIRKVGSGNPGFNNVLRVNKGRAVLTLIGDMAKGYLPLLAFYDPAHDPQWHGWLFAFAAVFGHCYSPFLKFNGGKGIATSAGVMLRLFPFWALLGLGFFVAVRLSASRLGWREGGAAASLATWIFFSGVLWLRETPLDAKNAALMTVFVAWRHQANIRRMFAA